MYLFIYSFVPFHEYLSNAYCMSITVLAVPVRSLWTSCGIDISQAMTQSLQNYTYDESHEGQRQEGRISGWGWGGRKAFPEDTVF